LADLVLSEENPNSGKRVMKVNSFCKESAASPSREKERLMKKQISVLAVAISLFISVLGQEPQPKPTVPQTTPATTPTPQQSEESDDVVRITTKLVQVDATVSDRSGKQVTNLGIDDFEITENGRPQKITNFSYIAPFAAQPRQTTSSSSSSSNPKDRT